MADCHYVNSCGRVGILSIMASVQKSTLSEVTHAAIELVMMIGDMDVDKLCYVYLNMTSRVNCNRME